MSKLAMFGGDAAVRAKAPMWPAVTDEDIAAVARTLQRSRDDVSNLTSVLPGGVVAEFEAAAADFFGAPYCATTNSGGAALHAAMVALGVGVGDEVIVSPYTWGQSVACVLQQCAVPVFADIDARTYTLDPAAVEQVITPYTKAIVVPHIFGLPADMPAIREVADRHGLKVVEDCAQATGAAIGDMRVGTFGDIGCFSIGSGKQIIGGEGGFVLTADRDIYDRLLLATQHPVRCMTALASDDLRGLLDTFIYTYRIHPLAAAICRRQLDDLDAWNGHRQEQLRELSARLSGCPGVEPVYEPDERDHVYHSYNPTYRPDELEGLPRARYIAALAAEGVPVSASYVGTPLHLSRRFQERRGYVGGGLPWSAAPREIAYLPGDCPVAEYRCTEVDLSLFLGANLYRPAPELLDQVAAAFAKVAAGYGDLIRYESEAP